MAKVVHGKAHTHAQIWGVPSISNFLAGALALLIVVALVWAAKTFL